MPLGSATSNTEQYALEQAVSSLAPLEKALTASAKSNIAVSGARAKIAREGPLFTASVFNQLLGVIGAGSMSFDQWLTSPDGNLFNSQLSRIRSAADASARAEVGDFFQAQGSGGFEAQAHASNILAGAGAKGADVASDFLLNQYRTMMGFQSQNAGAAAGVIGAGFNERLNFLNQDTSQSNAINAQTGVMLATAPETIKQSALQTDILAQKRDLISGITDKPIGGLNQLYGNLGPGGSTYSYLAALGASTRQNQTKSAGLAALGTV